MLRASLPNIQIARQSRPGYANAMADGELWRVYTTGDAGRAVQVAMRDTVREEIATSAALAAAAPILIIIPLSWLVVGWAMNRVLGGLKTWQMTSRLAAPRRRRRFHRWNSHGSDTTRGKHEWPHDAASHSCRCAKTVSGRRRA